jgi:hypothetical protein
LKSFARHSRISHNTIRQDLKGFAADGLLAIHGPNIRFKRLYGAHQRWYAIYRNYQFEIDKAQDHAGYFAGLIHRQEMKVHFSRQAYKEAEKICDPLARIKYLRTVHQTPSPVGALQGIYCGIGTLSRVFGKSRSTAWRYAVRAEANGVIGIRRNFTFIGVAGTMSQYLSIRQQYRAYGRTVWSNSTGKIYVRDLNDYVL